MVDFETQVYDKSATDDIVGVEVIVKNDVGEVIETIQVHNKTEFEALVDELNSKLDVLDETYVQFADDSELAGQNLDTILENSNEDAVINALTLNGFSSDRFSKTGHTHTKSDISNMLNYEIAASSYNVNIDSEVTISVTVTDMRDRPVANSPVVIKKNGEGWVNGYTNSQGVFSSVYTASEWGVCRFSIKSYVCFINVNGWKQVYNNGGLVIYKNNSLTKMVCDVRNFSCPSGGWTTVRTYDSTYNPPTALFFSTNNYNVSLRVYGVSGRVECYNKSSSTTMNLQFVAIY